MKCLHHFVLQLYHKKLPKVYPTNTPLKPQTTAQISTNSLKNFQQKIEPKDLDLNNANLVPVHEPDDDVLLKILENFEKNENNPPPQQNPTSTMNISNVSNIQNHANTQSNQALAPKMFFSNNTITINYNFNK